MSRLFALTLFAILVPLAGAGEERKASGSLARFVAPYIHARTFGVAHVDLARLDLAELSRWIEKQKLDLPQARQLTGLLEALRRAGVQHVCVLLDLDQDIGEPPPVVITLEPGSSVRIVATVLRGLLTMVPNAQLEERDGHLLVGGASTLKRLGQVKTVDRPEVAKVLGSRQGGVHHLLLFLPDDLRRAFDETVPELPAQLGGGSIHPLTRGLRWLALGMDLPPKPRLTLTLQAADEHSARAIKEILSRGVRVLGRAPQSADWPGLNKMLADFQLKVEGDRLSWAMGEEGAGLLVETLRQVRGASEERDAATQLKQILIALHNYAGSHRSTFPPAVFTDKAGKPLLSWRVHILPFIEEQALYNEFHLDEPWDSEHNKKLISRIPKVFASPSRPELARQGKTTYLVPVGKDTVFPGTTGIRIQDITDGTSNTIALVDVIGDRAVIWTKPDDLPIDLDNPSKGLDLSVRKKYMVGIADGSVRFLSKGISKQTLRAAFTRAGGEVLGPDW